MADGISKKQEEQGVAQFEYPGNFIRNCLSATVWSNASLSFFPVLA